MKLIRSGVDELTVKRTGRRRWNQLFREALVAAAMIWPVKFLHKRFEPGGKRQYNLQPRGARYEARKNRYARDGLIPVRFGQTIKIVKGAGFRNQPLVFSGAMRDQVTRQRYSAKATATAKRQTVRIPIPLGHPVPQFVADEVRRLRPSELQEMHNVAHVHLMASIDAEGVDVVE